MTSATATTPTLGSFRLPPAVRAVAPFLDPRTWGSVLYVWLGFPLGLAWFIGLTVGLLTGLALTILWVGLLLLFVTLLAAWGAEGLERRLAILLLGAEVPVRRERPAGANAPEGVKVWLRSVFTRAPLWKGLLFLALRFPLGLVGWVVSVVSLSVSVAFLAAPFAVASGLGGISIGSWQSESPWATLPLALLGLISLVATLHLHRGIGWAWARLAEMLLGGTEPDVAGSEGGTEPVETQSAGAIESRLPAE